MGILGHCGAAVLAQAWIRICSHPQLQPVRRFAHNTAYGGGGGGAGFQVICKRGNHFWSSSEETVLEVDAEATTTSTSTRKVSVVDERKITQAAPDWLPLVPGSSYWIPSEDEKDRRPKLNLTDEKLTACFSPCGWPVLSDNEDDSDSDDEDVV